MLRTCSAEVKFVAILLVIIFCVGLAGGVALLVDGRQKSLAFGSYRTIEEAEAAVGWHIPRPRNPLPFTLRSIEVTGGTYDAAERPTDAKIDEYGRTSNHWVITMMYGIEPGQPTVMIEFSPQKSIRAIEGLGPANAIEIQGHPAILQEYDGPPPIAWVQWMDRYAFSAVTLTVEGRGTRDEVGLDRLFALIASIE